MSNTININIDAIETAYTQAAGSWTECDWSTGSDYIAEASDAADARNMIKAAQEDLTGAEAMQSLHAWDGLNYEWLDDPTDPMLRNRAKEDVIASLEKLAEYHEGVETAAHAAEAFGAAALAAIRAGDLEAAIEQAEYACSEEREYGDCPTWGPLWDAIDAEINPEIALLHA